eukprot:scaffold15318_cov36-Phaeocystis_antarctica.AAC.2
MPQPDRPHAPQPEGVAQLERVRPRRLAVRRESEEGAVERTGLIGDAHTWMARRSGIGDLGGGWLEHSRQWLGSQWPGLTVGVTRCPEPPGAP